MRLMLNIGLHSQSYKNKNKIIAGSEITTNGLHQALMLRKEINHIYRFSPTHKYNNYELNLDLLIIEGWDNTLSTFIKLIRNKNPNVKIIFWNLSFFGFNDVIKLDVDAYFCNSHKVCKLLNKIKPTKFLMLAADSKSFTPLNQKNQYVHNVVFLGMNHKSKSQRIQHLILEEAMPFGLAIYGAGWESHTKLKPFWKGKLPWNEIPSLYSSAKIVLGTTEDRQRKVGMINNRVFEALASGACFISEYYDELHQTFGDAIFYAKKKGDTKIIIKKILESKEEINTHKEKVRQLIVNEHSYNNRVCEIIDFFLTMN